MRTLAKMTNKEETSKWRKYHRIKQPAYRREKQKLQPNLCVCLTCKYKYRVWGLGFEYRSRTVPFMYVLPSYWYASVSSGGSSHHMLVQCFSSRAAMWSIFSSPRLRQAYSSAVHIVAAKWPVIIQVVFSLFYWF
jgi:hypothetical protein